MIYPCVIEGFQRGCNVVIMSFGFLPGIVFWVRNQRFGTICLSHLQGLKVNQERTSDTPGKNPKGSIQHDIPNSFISEKMFSFSNSMPNAYLK